MATAMALRDLLLAAERAKQPLDAAVQRFAQAAAGDARLLAALLDVSPQAEPLVAHWPDETGKGSRWEDRESIALFLELMAKLLHLQAHERNAQDAAEALALKIVREKSASLEKMLSWSDKPIVEFRVLELMATIVGVGASCARELVRIFNFQSAVFTKIATRRMKKAPAVAAAPEEEEPDQDSIALSTTASTTAGAAATPAAAPAFQIRAAYVHLVAALAACPDKSVHRFALKDGGVMASLFKSLDGDDAAMLATVIGHLETLVLRNENVDMRGRMAILNNASVQQLVAVIKSDDDDVASQAWTLVVKLFFEDGALYQLPARQAMRLFLLKPSANVPLSADAVDISSADNNSEASGAVAKVIRNVMGSIGLNEYIRSGQVRAMVSTFLRVYPGLVAEFLGNLAPQLEPKTGYRWFCVASMLQNVLSTPIDAMLSDKSMTSSQAVDASVGYTAQILASRLIMPLSCRKELSRGLQHTTNLVVYSSLGLIECALRRFQFVQSNLATGIARSELESELRFLLPSPETLVSLLMKLCTNVETAALVYLRALTVFRLYLECLPLAMSESKADFTKLLAWQFLDQGDGNTSRAIRGVIVGEILRVLMVVDEARLRYVITSGAVANGEVSKLSQLLRMYSSQTDQTGDAGRSLARAVLFRVFVALKVFGSGSDVSSPSEEIEVWLDNMATGGDNTTAFVEMIVQDLLSDPFSFLSTSAEESVSPSPATLALIAVVKSRWPLARSAPKLETLRQNVTVAAFTSRVLMSLMCCSSEPTVVARLLCADDSTISEGDSSKRSSKKRRRSDSIDLGSITPFQCVLVVAQTILAPANMRSATPSASTASEWKVVKSKDSFGEALFGLHATTFAVQFPNIVQDLLRLQLPSQWLHHYIRARPDVNLVALKEVVKSTVKKDKHAGPVLRDLIDNMPLDVISQCTQFALSVGAKSADTSKDVMTLIAQLKGRLGDARCEDFQHRVIALVAEQLLNCVELARHAKSTILVDSLSDVLLRVQILLRNVSDGNGNQGLRRLHSKLRRATSLTTSPNPKLNALDLIALASASTNGILSNSDLLRLRHRGSSVGTAMLARGMPIALRLQILGRLLKKTPGHYPLVSHIIQTLNGVSSVDGYKDGSRLSRRVWEALIPTKGGIQDLQVLSAGLHVVAKLGGVSEQMFRDSVPASWTRYLTDRFDDQSRDTTVSFGELVQFVRRLGGAVCDQDIVVAPSAAFEDLIHQIMKSSYRQKNGRLTALAVVLIATYGSSVSGVASQYIADRALISQSIESAMEGTSPMHSSMGLIVLRHASMSGTQTSKLQLATLKLVLASFKNSVSTSPSQVLALLLSMRRHDLFETGWSPEIATFLVRSAVNYAMHSDEANEFDERTLQSLRLMLSDLIAESTSNDDIQGVLSKAAPDMKRMVTVDISAETTAFHRFIRASRVVIKLVSHLHNPEKATLKGYSISEHFKKLTSHELFSTSLRDPAINVEILRLLASMLRLGGADLYNRTVFQQLLGAYDVSLSLPDRMIRTILDEFESKAGILASHYGYRFGSSCMTVQSHKQDGSVRSDLIEDSAWLFSGGLEPSRVRATIERFPLYRGISVKNDGYLLLDDEECEENEDDCADVDDASRAVVYDPSYLLPMLSRFVSSSALPEAAVIQQGVVGMALRAASSNADDVREYAYAILAHVHESLSADAATDFKPGRQVHLMLDTLRNALQEPLEGVSSVITVFMNDAISILSRPGHTMYPHVNHFLLARPAFDLSDVPMFYSLFNSHSPQTYKQERSWLLHGLRRGVREDADVSLLIRRHVPSILLSFFGSDLADDHTQLLVCSILGAMLKTEAGAQYLLSKCAFLEWLTSRLHEASNSSIPVPILNALCTLFEDSLKSELWDHLEASQLQALSSAAVNCFEATVVAVQSRRTLSIAATNTQMARISLSVLQRAMVSCSLSTFTAVLSLAADVDVDSTALDCADELITEQLLAHDEFQKSRFDEWSKLFSRVARILALELRSLLHGERTVTTNAVTTPLGRDVRATETLLRLRGVLTQTPTLKLLVLQNLADDLTTKTLLL